MDYAREEQSARRVWTELQLGSLRFKMALAEAQGLPFDRYVRWNEEEG